MHGSSVWIRTALILSEFGCPGSGSVLGMWIRILQEHENLQKFTKAYQKASGPSKSDQDPDPHWFGTLDPDRDPHRDKKLDPDPH
jgi:hypothetical protein